MGQVLDESLDNDNMKMVERCIEISENYICSAPMEETSLISPSVFRPRFFSCFTAWWVYTKVLTLGVSVYERERRYGDKIYDLFHCDWCDGPACCNLLPYVLANNIHWLGC